MQSKHTMSAKSTPVVSNYDAMERSILQALGLVLIPAAILLLFFSSLAKSQPKAAPARQKETPSTHTKDAITDEAAFVSDIERTLKRAGYNVSPLPTESGAHLLAMRLPRDRYAIRIDWMKDNARNVETRAIYSVLAAAFTYYCQHGVIVTNADYSTSTQNLSEEMRCVLVRGSGRELIKALRRL